MIAAFFECRMVRSLAFSPDGKALAGAHRMPWPKFLLWNAAPDSTRAQEELGWEPTPLEDGIRESLA